MLNAYTDTGSTIITNTGFIFGDIEKQDTPKFFRQNTEVLTEYGFTPVTIGDRIISYLGEGEKLKISEPSTRNTRASLEELNFDEEIESGVTQKFADSQGQHFDFLSYTEKDLLDWFKWLESEELVEFFEELLKLITQISEGKKDATTLSTFLSEWRETALINSEPDVLADIAEAERELNAGGGKPWPQIKKEIGL